MNDELKNILEKHEKWLNDEVGGEQADLRGADLSNTDLHCVNLERADLYGANLYSTNLERADLYNADLCNANLYSADLRGADLRSANLRGANLRSANLYGADMCGADMCGADLYNAYLQGAKNLPFIPLSCPDSGSFTAWKKANEYIVKLLIPEDARRSSATGRKCRCDKAIVVAIETVDGVPVELNEIASSYYKKFIYKVGETVIEPNFCEDRFAECAAGIHFFVNRQEAVDYN